MLSKEERADWVRRGFKDPHRAFAQHAANADRRGIGFELTFEQWWEIWEPHYERRGLGSDQLMMCRTGDKGPYALGNVRIDSPKSNVQESVRVRLVAYRAENGGASDNWLWRRGRVFTEYAEDEGGEPVWSHQFPTGPDTQSYQKQTR